MGYVQNGTPLPESKTRPMWRTGPQATRGGKLIDVEISGAEVEGMTVVDDLTVDGFIVVSTAGSSIEPEAWTAISLQNSWVDFGGSYGAARIRKGPDGVVQVQGMIKSGTTTATTLIFQIPNGMRPGTQLMIPLADQTGSAAAYVTTSGGFRIQYGFTGTWTSITSSWVAA